MFRGGKISPSPRAGINLVIECSDTVADTAAPTEFPTTSPTKSPTMAPTQACGSVEVLIDVGRSRDRDSSEDQGENGLRAAGAAGECVDAVFGCDSCCGYSAPLGRGFLDTRALESSLSDLD